MVGLQDFIVSPSPLGTNLFRVSFGGFKTKGLGTGLDKIKQVYSL